MKFSDIFACDLWLRFSYAKTCPGIVWHAGIYLPVTPAGREPSSRMLSWEESVHFLFLAIYFWLNVHKDTTSQTSTTRLPPCQATRGREGEYCNPACAHAFRWIPYIPCQKYTVKVFNEYFIYFNEEVYNITCSLGDSLQASVMLVRIWITKTKESNLHILLWSNYKWAN